MSENDLSFFPHNAFLQPINRRDTQVEVSILAGAQIVPFPTVELGE
jgi:hypothetical protein